MIKAVRSTYPSVRPSVRVLCVLVCACMCVDARDAAVLRGRITN